MPRLDVRNEKNPEVEALENLLTEIRKLHEPLESALQSNRFSGGGGSGNSTTQIWNVLSRIATIILLPWLVWLSLAIMDIKSTISGYAGREFTKTEAAALEQRMRQERIQYVDASIDALRRELTAMMRTSP